jgi:hypothetical protein
MSDQQKVNALLVRLEHVTSIELSDAIKELLSLSAPPDLVAKIVEGRVDEGVYVLSETLASLLATSHSKTLYEKVLKQVKDDVWSLLTLYKGKYPDIEIEKALIKKLYSAASNDADPLRRYIVSAMKEVGSEAILPTLQAIAHDLEPGAKVGKFFGNALGPIEGLAAQSRYSFLQDVLVAIDEIELRAKLNPPSGDLSLSVDKSEHGFDDTSNAYQNKVDAKKYLELAPGIVIFYVRKGAEALAKDLYRHLGLEKGGRPAKRMMLEELINQLKQVKKSSAPDLLQVFLQTFQAFGNFASHDQGNEEKHITKEIAEPIYNLYCQALILYTSWLKTAPRESSNNE